ncbi:xylulokinase [Candidatus Epulonipiscium viviparus]|uniref:xylulokinase n=1 Tax=Candidatus Epulonipiscium viviparus TaxID=420336 RepID=UPI0027380D6F|nr:FGGY-family carbohydrate kinase [Candidatus Epulopiscium viviparus]
MDKYLMGMDIGTSSCKVAIFDTKGEVVAQTNGEYHTYYPQEGFVEQNPEEWWNAVCEASKLCIQKANINPEQIAGVGVAGQSWSAIAVDVDGNILVNNPIWMDRRSSDICKILTNQLGPQRIFELSGNSLQPTYTTGKIIYYKLHHPAVYERIFAILQSNSYIVYKLTGEFSQDKSQGYGIHCYDMKEGTWDQDMCAQLGIKASILPKIYECSDIVGAINKTAAEKSGLLEGTKVVAGGLDAACATLGVGVIHNGQTQEQGGQAGGMSICIDTYKADSRLILSNHVVPGKWLLQGGTTGGGGVMRWVERELGDRGTAKERGLSSFDYLNEIAAAVPAGSDGVTFLPYMAGERSPIWNPCAKGVYYGLDFSKTRGHMVRSSMEGVAYSLKHNLDIAKDAGASVKELVATGGSANSLLWTQIKSDVTGKDIIVPASDEATPLGAAILAGVGVGIYDSFEDAVRRCVTIKRMHTANKDNQLTYGQGYKKYLKLYDLLEDMMQPQEN